jgi:hypothetical protein
MTVFCKYRHALGVENKGVHSYRLLNIAVVDMVLTIVLAFFIAIRFRTSFLLIFFILLIIATLLHKLFCVNSTITKLVFGESIEK